MTDISIAKFDARSAFIAAVNREGHAVKPFNHCLVLAEETGLAAFFYHNITALTDDVAKRWRQGTLVPHHTIQPKVLKKIRDELTSARSHYVVD